MTGTISPRRRRQVVDAADPTLEHTAQDRVAAAVEQLLDMRLAGVRSKTPASALAPPHRRVVHQRLVPHDRPVPTTSERHWLTWPARQGSGATSDWPCPPPQTQVTPLPSPRESGGAYARHMRRHTLQVSGRVPRAAPVTVLLLAGALLVGCAGDRDDGAAASPDPVATSESASPQFPDIISAEVTSEREGTYAVAVTVSSPYDSPDRYADGWRVLGPDGTVLCEHTLTHDHAGEQPFTRTQTGLMVPGDVTEVTVEGRDRQSGYGGETVTADVLPPAEP